MILHKDMITKGLSLLATSTTWRRMFATVSSEQLLRLFCEDFVSVSETSVCNQLNKASM